jgi:hypothetical protein
VQFVAYDVFGILKQSENVLGADVGNGFHAGDQGDDRFFWPCVRIIPMSGMETSYVFLLRYVSSTKMNDAKLSQQSRTGS